MSSSSSDSECSQLHSKFSKKSKNSKHSKEKRCLPIKTHACKELIINGRNGRNGKDGKPGKHGKRGKDGCDGKDAKFVISTFYALTPPDNSPIVAGAPVNFPQNGPSSYGGIIRDGLFLGSFILQYPGIYKYDFNVPITEPGQLVVRLDSGSGLVEQKYTVVGRATGNTQIVGSSTIQTFTPNVRFSVGNPATAPAPLTIPPNSGGSLPVSSTLNIFKVCA